VHEENTAGQTRALGNLMHGHGRPPIAASFAFPSVLVDQMMAIPEGSIITNVSFWLGL
jgi:hypothetical protein